MEQNENSLSFDQLPKAVGELLHKVDYVISRLDAPKNAEEASGREPEEQMMIQSGGAYDAPYTLSEKEQAEFDAHLEQLREKKRHKPMTIQEDN